MELRIGRGSPGERTVELAGRLVVGRDESCEIVLDDEQASRRHAALTVGDDGLVTIEDLGSTNGTTVDGHRLTGPRTLRGGERIQIGGTVLELQASSGSTPTTIEPAAGASPPPPRPSVVQRLALRRSVRSAWLAAGAAVALLAGLAVALLFVTGVVGGDDDEPSVEEAIEAILPSTVQVRTVAGGRTIGSGSGWVYDAGQGLVVTNWHVSDLGSQGYTVRLGEETREREATLVGTATCEDMAVLRVTDTEGMQSMPLASQGDLRQGDTVVVVGFPATLVGGDPLVAVSGIISVVRAKSVPLGYTGALPNVVQIDAPSNPGNSGGPAVTVDGELAGMTTFGNTSVAVQEQKYMIGVDRVKAIAPKLLEGSLGWFGLALLPQAPDGPAGLYVSDVFPGTSAADAGVPVGSTVVAVDGQPVADFDSYCALVGELGPGQGATVSLLLPDGQTVDVPLTVPARLDG